MFTAGADVVVRVPGYFDFMIRDFQMGRGGRQVHLGHWDALDGLSVGAVSPHAFARAQTRLEECLLELARIESGHEVLDVGCGFGGTLQRIDNLVGRVTSIGLNIDVRQLRICAQLRATPSNRLHWTCGDAGALPLRSSTFDRVLCVEAMPHFRSRRRFLKECARVLRPHGMLTVSDILVHRGAGDHLGMSDQHLAEQFDLGLGPWPAPFGSVEDVVDLAERCGFAVESYVDASRATAPSHAFTAPDRSYPQDDPRAPYHRAATMLAQLHRDGFVSYPYLSFVRQRGATP